MARMIARALVGAPFVALFLSLAPAQALAAPASAAEHERSRAEYASGNEAFRLAQYEKARGHYLTALQNERAFDVVCNLGRTEAMLGDDALALRHLDECLKEYPPGEKVAAAREKFFELREEVRARCRKKNCEAPAPAQPAPAPAAEPAPAPPPAEPAPPPPPAESSSARLPVALGLAAAGVVGLGVGVGSYVASSQQANEARAVGAGIDEAGGQCNPDRGPVDDGCKDFLDQVHASQDMYTVSVVGFAAGGALLGAALLTYLFWPESEATGSRIHPQFALSPDGKSGHLGVWGSF